MQNYIYVVFSTTPYKIGAFIRKMTHCQYNHVSISFDDRLHEMYSFARYYINAPFYAGIVHESANRYFKKGKCASVKVCKIPVTNEQFVRAKEIVAKMLENKQRYIYNLISAIVYPFKKRVIIPNAYTCIDFALEVCAEAGIDIGVGAKDYVKTDRLAEMLNDYTFFEGNINKIMDCEGYQTRDDKFFEKRNFFVRMKLTLCNNGRLIKAFVKRK